MITAMMTRDLALPAPDGGPAAVVVGFDDLSYDLRRAALRLGDLKPRRTSSATPMMITWPAL
jgi:hypothetical protein